MGDPAAAFPAAARARPRPTGARIGAAAATFPAIAERELEHDRLKGE
jgi:hypothetical protein